MKGRQSALATFFILSALMKTVGISSVPEVLRFNTYVWNKYRKSPASAKDCLISLFYIHNETLNVLSHLLPLLCILTYLFHNSWVFASPSHIVFALAAVACCFTFAGSVVYHLFMPAAAKDARFYGGLLFSDVVGVWSLNLVVLICSLFVGYPCMPFHLKLSISLSVAVMTLIPLFTTKSAKHRGFLFLGMTLARFILLAVRFYHGAGTLNGIVLFLGAEALSTLGGAINVLRIPERFFPGTFDLMNSHTIMHICVVAATSCLLFCLYSEGHYILDDLITRSCVVEQYEPILKAVLFL